MDTLNRFFICLLWVMFVMPQAMAQQTDAKKIMEEVEAGFRKAGGLRIGFSMQASSGQSSGTIELKDEKFVLYAGGVTTWFDGHTQWSYLVSAGEVNISEPTPEELQTLNPYAWLSLYRNGYRAQLLQPVRAGDASRYYGVQLTAPAAGGSMEALSITLYVQKNTYRPARIVLQQGGEDVEIVVENYEDGLLWSDSHFVFDASKYPDAEVIDLR